MVPTSWFLLLALCSFTAAAPVTVVTYNQTQFGHNNLRADIEKVLILIVPPRDILKIAAGMFGKSDSVDLPQDVSHHQIKDPVDQPESAKPEENVVPDAVSAPVVIPAVVATLPPGKLEQIVAALEPAVDRATSSRGSRAFINLRPLVFAPVTNNQ